jgi:O-succinylhomoserine sulfhydrylase
LAHKGAIAIVDNVFVPVFSDEQAQVQMLLFIRRPLLMDRGGRWAVWSGHVTYSNLGAPFQHTGGRDVAVHRLIMLKGLETMELRVRAQTQAALEDCV